MLAMITSLLTGTVGEWLKGRHEIETAKAHARIKAVSTGIPGYSDNYLVFVWSYPFIGGFIPILQPSVAAGFEFFEQLPEWYIAGFMSITFAVFGIDKLFKIDWPKFRRRK